MPENETPITPVDIAEAAPTEAQAQMAQQAGLDLSVCTLLDADLPPDLRAALDEMAEAEGGALHWCVMAAEAFLAQSAAAPPLPETSAPAVWCGDDIPAEIVALLNDHHAQLGLDIPPGGWCVIGRAAAAELAPPTVTQQEYSPASPLTLMQTDTVDGAHFMLFAAIGASAAARRAANKRDAAPTRRRAWASDDMRELT